MNDGIDISHHNGSVNFDQVAVSGTPYVFMKATQGDYFTDSTFLINAANSANRHLPNGKEMMTGAYMFFDPRYLGLPQAQRFINVVRSSGVMFRLPPTVDFEPFPGVTLEWMMANKILCYTRLVECVLEIARQMESPQIYTADWVVNQMQPVPSVIRGLPLWMADYQPPYPIPGGWTAYLFHQYTSSGSVPGVTGNVDKNRWAGTDAEFYSYALLSTRPRPSTTPPPPTVPDAVRVKVSSVSLRSNTNADTSASIIGYSSLGMLLYPEGYAIDAYGRMWWKLGRMMYVSSWNCTPV